MRIILIMCFVLFIHHTYGQEYNYIDDSLLNFAIEKYSNLIEKDSTYDSLYYNRAFMYRLKNDTVKAINDINKAIELSKNKAGFYYEKGLIYWNFGDYDSSIVYLEKSFNMDSLNSETYLYLIDSYVHLKNYDKALNYLKKGMYSGMYRRGYTITVTPGLLPDIYIIANIFERGYKTDTTQFKGLFGAGLAFFLKKEMDSSQYYLEKYVQISPDDSIIPEAYFMLGAIYLENDNLVVAKKYIKKAYEKGYELPEEFEAFIGLLDENNPYTNYWKGLDFFTREEYDSAALYIQKYVELSGDSAYAVAYVMLGLISGEKSDSKAAKKYFKKAKEIDPESLNVLIEHLFDE